MNELNSYATHYGHAQHQNRSVSPANAIAPSPNHSPSNTPTSPSVGLYTGPHNGVQNYHNNMMRYPPYIKQGIPSHLSAMHAQSSGQTTLNQLASIQANPAQPQPAANTTKYEKEQQTIAAQCRSASGAHYHARAAAIKARQSSNSAAMSDSNGGVSLVTTISKTTSTTTNAASTPDEQQWSTLDLGGMGMKNLSTELFRYSFLTTLYINHNNISHISPEFALLRNLTVLDATANKLTSLPVELGMLTKLKELLLCDNYITNLPARLGTLYNLTVIGLEGNPLNDPYKSLLRRDGPQALINYLRENMQPPSAPPDRNWIKIDKEASKEDSFTVLDYNILAEKYATQAMYGYTPSSELAWSYRRNIILAEIRKHDADIVCLQEMQSDQYEEFFKDELYETGDYESVFWPKSRAKTMGKWEKKSVDGCATFFKSSKYKLLEKQLVEFSQLALQKPDLRKTEEVYNRVMTKDNIAVLTLLENRENGSRLLVTNAHVHWDPTFKDVKLLQVAMMMEEIEKWASEYIKIPPTRRAKSDAPSPNSSIPTTYTSTPKLPTIICGDLNSEPSSGVCEFLTRGTAKQNHDDFGNFAYGNYTTQGFAHSLTLRSAYGPGYELPFTNYTPPFSGVIDYIWYTSNTLTVSALLGPVDSQYLSQVVGFPNAHFASDHLAILAEFRIKPTAATSVVVHHNQPARKQSHFGK